MRTNHIFILTVVSALVALSGCASMDASSQPQQLASRDCKAVPADFVNRPTKNPTRAELAAAEMKLSRLAIERGGYTGIGNSTLSDLARECN